MKKASQKNKTVTIDDLALMVKGGFDDTNGRIDHLERKMDKGFAGVDKRLDTIENKMIAQHTREIEHLRDKVLQLEVKFAKFSK